MSSMTLCPLTTENVDAVIRDCLLTKEEAEQARPLVADPTALMAAGYKAVDGVVGRFVFQMARVEKNKDKIKAMLSELHPSFLEGMSFLRMPFKGKGEEDSQWGEQRDADILLILGLAAGLVEFCAPREMWWALPGSMPYVKVL